MKIKDNSILLTDKQITIVSDRKFYVDVDNIRLVYEDDKLAGYYFPDIVQPDMDLKLWRALESLEFIETNSDTFGHTLGWKLRYGEKMFGGYINLDGCVTANDVNRLIDRIKAVVKSQEEILDHIPEDDIVPVVRCEQCRCNIENGGDCDRRVIWEDCVDPTSYTYRPLRFCSFGMKVV